MKKKILIFENIPVQWTEIITIYVLWFVSKQSFTLYAYTHKTVADTENPLRWGPSNM